MKLSHSAADEIRALLPLYETQLRRGNIHDSIIARNVAILRDFVSSYEDRPPRPASTYRYDPTDTHFF